MAEPQAIIFDFDGVLLESEYEGNRMLAELLTELGHETTTEDALRDFVGLAGPQFLAAIERRIGGSLPEQFVERRKAQTLAALRDGVPAVAGAVEFIRSLPPDLPKAVASSSSMRWLQRHLALLGLAEAFGPHVYSGREQFDWVDIHLALDPPAFGDPDINVTHTFNHLHLHLEFDLIA